MTLPVIDEHTDLDAAICDLRADQAELQRREQAINAEAYLRADKIRRAHEAQFKAQIDALKEKRRADHAELVRQCRAAKDALAAHECRGGEGTAAREIRSGFTGERALSGGGTYAAQP